MKSIKLILKKQIVRFPDNSGFTIGEITIGIIALVFWVFIICEVDEQSKKLNHDYLKFLVVIKFHTVLPRMGLFIVLYLSSILSWNSS